MINEYINALGYMTWAYILIGYGLESTRISKYDVSK